jgi:hypothetical protein
MKARERERFVDRLQHSYLSEAHIIFSTLSGAGSDLLSNLGRGFDAMVIDEAAQSVELSTLVALRHNVHHCVLVGDPRQLPATVFMSSSNARRYERSLFERLESGGHRVLSLTMQYRMHPEIRRFPSLHFYSDRLEDGPNVLTPAYNRPYHHDSRFQPFLFYDVRVPSASTNGSDSSPARHRNGRKSSKSKSLSNETEAIFIVKLIAELERLYSSCVERRDIGVITFYQDQRSVFERLLLSRLPERKSTASTATTPAADGSDEKTAGASSSTLSSTTSTQSGSSNHNRIEVSTVDGFQGREKDIIIISCVRSQGMGFVADVRRMNVALTRARHACWVVGDSRALRSSPVWRELLSNAEERGLFRVATPAGEAPPSNTRLLTGPDIRVLGPPVTTFGYGAGGSSSLTALLNVLPSPPPTSAQSLSPSLRPLPPPLLLPPQLTNSGPVPLHPSPITTMPLAIHDNRFDRPPSPPRVRLKGHAVPISDTSPSTTTPSTTIVPPMDPRRRALHVVPTTTDPSLSVSSLVAAAVASVTEPPVVILPPLKLEGLPTHALSSITTLPPPPLTTLVSSTSLPSSSKPLIDEPGLRVLTPAVPVPVSTWQASSQSSHLQAPSNGSVASTSPSSSSLIRHQLELAKLKLDHVKAVASSALQNVPSITMIAPLNVHKSQQQQQQPRPTMDMPGSRPLWETPTTSASVAPPPPFHAQQQLYTPLLPPPPPLPLPLPLALQQHQHHHQSSYGHPLRHDYDKENEDHKQMGPPTITVLAPPQPLPLHHNDGRGHDQHHPYHYDNHPLSSYHDNNIHHALPIDQQHPQQHSDEYDRGHRYIDTTSQQHHHHHHPHHHQQQQQPWHDGRSSSASSSSSRRNEKNGGYRRSHHHKGESQFRPL